MNSLNTLISYNRSNKQGDFAALLNAAAIELAPTLKFESKEDYLSWRKQWREAYAYLTKKIRHDKNEKRLKQALLPEKIERLENAQTPLRVFLRITPKPQQVSEAFKGFYTTNKGAARYLLALRKASKLAVSQKAPTPNGSV